MKPEKFLLSVLSLACAGALAQATVYPVPAQPAAGDSPSQFSNGGALQPESAPSPYADPQPLPDATSGGVQAPTESGPGSTPPPAPALMEQPAPQVMNGYRYLCGGVGANEASLMKGEARDHDLMLTFAARDGAYLADVDVHIADARGEHTLNVTCDGPIMLVDVPASGNYRIVARSGEQERSRTVIIRGAQHARSQTRSVTMVWAAPAEDSSFQGHGDSGMGASGGPAGAAASGR